MKSFIMAYYFLSVAFGNLLTSAVNFFIQNDDGTSKLDGASYFWFFTILMTLSTVVFIFVCSYFHKNKLFRYDQG